MARRQRRAVSNKLEKCNLCFHSSAQLISGLHAKTLRFKHQSAAACCLQRKSGGAWRPAYSMCLPASACGWESEASRIYTVRDAAVLCD